MLADPETAAAMASAAKERSLTLFSPQRMIDDTLGVYEVAMSGGRR
jgi:hypothetical protein